MADAAAAVAKPEMSEGRKAAFEKCKAARAAALARKRQLKEDNLAAAARGLTEPVAVAAEPVGIVDEATSSVESVEPVEFVAPGVAPATLPVAPATNPEAAAGDDLEFVDASHMIDLISSQGETLKSMREELAAMRAAQTETAQRAADMSQSLAQHGVKQAFSLNFV